MADVTFAGLDLLATAVVVLDDDYVVRYANPAAENLLTAGVRSLIGHPFLGFFAERTDLERALERGMLTLRGYDRVVKLAWTVSDLSGGGTPTRDDVGLALTLRAQSLVAA